MQKCPSTSPAVSLRALCLIQQPFPEKQGSCTAGAGSGKTHRVKHIPWCIHLHPTRQFLHLPFTAERKEICSVSQRLQHSKEGWDEKGRREPAYMPSIPGCRTTTHPHISSLISHKPVSSQSHSQMKRWGCWGTWEHCQKSDMCIQGLKEQPALLSHEFALSVYQPRTYKSVSKSFLSWGMAVSLLTRWKTWPY